MYTFRSSLTKTGEIEAESSFGSSAALLVLHDQVSLCAQGRFCSSALSVMSVLGFCSTEDLDGWTLCGMCMNRRIGVAFCALDVGWSEG